MSSEGSPITRSMPSMDCCPRIGHLRSDLILCKMGWSGGYRRTTRLVPIENMPHPKEEPFLKQLEANEMRGLLRKVVDALREPCRSILKGYYFHRIALVDLVEAVPKKEGGKYTPGSLRVKKYQCMRSLRGRFQQMGGI